MYFYKNKSKKYILNISMHPKQPGGAGGSDP